MKTLMGNGTIHIPYVGDLSKWVFAAERPKTEAEYYPQEIRVVFDRIDRPRPARVINSELIELDARENGKAGK